MSTFADPKTTVERMKGPENVRDHFDWVEASFAEDANAMNQMAAEYRRLAKTFFDNQAPVPNGKCDSVTVTWIRMFQMRHLRRYVSAIDGRVDPINPQSGPFARSTMIRLNVSLPVWRVDIANTDAPGVLKNALRDFRS